MYICTSEWKMLSQYVDKDINENIKVFIELDLPKAKRLQRK